MIVFRHTKIIIIDFKKRKALKVKKVRNEWEVADPGTVRGKDEGNGGK